LGTSGEVCTQDASPSPDPTPPMGGLEPCISGPKRSWVHTSVLYPRTSPLPSSTDHSWVQAERPPLPYPPPPVLSPTPHLLPDALRPQPQALYPRSPSARPIPTRLPDLEAPPTPKRPTAAPALPPPDAEEKDGKGLYPRSYPKPHRSTPGAFGYKTPAQPPQRSATSPLPPPPALPPIPYASLPCANPGPRGDHPPHKPRVFVMPPAHELRVPDACPPATKTRRKWSKMSDTPLSVLSILIKPPSTPQNFRFLEALENPLNPRISYTMTPFEPLPRAP